MEKKEKRIYETPRLTTVTFRAERGYATSGLTTFYLALSNSVEALSVEGVSSSLEGRNDANGYTWGNGTWQ